jgi:hypothetical protein
VVTESADSSTYETIALKALESDPKRNHKVYLVENTMKRLVKAGASNDKYKAMAKEVFPLAKVFD